MLLNGDLYWRDRDGILLLCLGKGQADKMLKGMRQSICGGHFITKTTPHKTMRTRYYWPKLFANAHKFVRRCEACQRFSRKLKYEGALPLRPFQVKAPFYQWGINFISEITKKSSGGHMWILVSIDYSTKWIEVVPTKQATSKVVINFLIKNIFTIFVVPDKLILDNAMCFRCD